MSYFFSTIICDATSFKIFRKHCLQEPDQRHWLYQVDPMRMGDIASDMNDCAKLVSVTIQTIEKSFQKTEVKVLVLNIGTLSVSITWLIVRLVYFRF